MSLQGVYASCLEGCGGLERYQVYAYLKRAGYIIQRAPEGPEVAEALAVTVLPPVAPAGVGIFTTLAARLGKLLTPAPPAAGPLIAPGAYRSYPEIYQRLALIPSHHPPRSSAHAPSTASATAPFRIAYHIWKPRPNFKKSDPPPPDFRVAVVSARETSMPTLQELAGLFEGVPVDESVKEKSQFARLKEGWRNVVIAVVDSGVTSYIKVADVGFAGEEMWKVKPGGGRGGKGGGRGRGGRGGGRGGGERGSAVGRGRGR